jgi:hypothetical protein
MTADEMDAETQAELQRFKAALEAARSAGMTLPFWWRDDDAVEVTPQLEEMLGLRETAGVPLALAIIPKFARPELIERIRRSGSVTVLQHGWAHEKHSPAGEKASEFGESRPLEDSLGDLTAGHERLAPMAGNLFLPVLTPPWNRIGDAARTARHRAGLPGLSVFGPTNGEAHVCNTHFDVIAWKTTRGFIGLKKAFHLLANEIERRLEASSEAPPEPIGILTHHLVHDSQTNAFLRQLLEILVGQPNVSWPPIDELFALERTV